MVTVTLFGGVNEIGGNKILVEDKDSRILLDFGMSYGERKKFYADPWLTPKDERGLLELGILPRIRGLYRSDELPAQIDAVFLTHAHSDHALYISMLKRSIPVYCGETTARLIKCFSETRRRDLESDTEGIDFRTFRTGDTIRVGEFEISPCHVDHSIPGAYGLNVETTVGNICYTGDFRMHGTASWMTEDFISEVKRRKPRLMIAEGTNLLGGEASSEGEVEQKIQEVIAETKKMILADFSLVDIDRFRTFYNCAKKNGRFLAISMKQAYLIHALAGDEKLHLPDVSCDDYIVIHRRQKKHYYDWEKEVLAFSNVKDSVQIRREQRRAVLVTTFSDIRELFDLRPDPASIFILSSSEPFNEEKEVEFEREMNWLNHFGLPMYHIHCSGHVMPNQLRSCVESVKPTELIPIHTEHQELYARYLSDIVPVTLVEKAGRVELGG